MKEPVRAKLGWWSALAVAVAMVAWDVRQNVRHYTELSATYGVAVRAPAVDEASPTGFADGRRNRVYPSGSLDGEHWIMQTQQMFARREGRIRWVDDDNAPLGRAVHWGSSFRWWLGGCALVERAFAGGSLAAATERAVLYANPALLLLLLLGFVPWVAGRFGGMPAGFLALALVASPPFAALFAADNPDHHGMIEVAVMGSVLALLAGGGGWLRADGVAGPEAWRWLPTAVQARRSFACSAVFGAWGMWLSAATMIPVLGGIGVGALASAWLGRRAPDHVRFDPGLWRRWGILGGGATLVAYLVEYFPGPMGWRLEVIHPLYAVAWLGAGEILLHGTAALSQGRLLPARPAWRRLVPAFVAVGLPAVVLWFGREKTFLVSSPYFWSMMHDYVPEFRGLLTALRLSGGNLATTVQWLPMLTLVVVAGWLLRRSTPPLVRAVMALPFSVTALIWLMGFKELRWWNVGFGLVFIVVLAALTMRRTLERRPALVGGGLCLLLFAPGLGYSVNLALKPRTVSTDDILGLVERDLAHGLRQRVGAGPLVVLSSPATTSRLSYFGSAAGLGTSYWENLDGLKRAGEIFAARNAEEAHALVQAAGITHLVFLSWDDFVEPYIRLARGLSPQEPITGSAFGLALLHAEPPPWLRRLPDHLPDHPALRGKEVRIYEVTDQVRPDQVLVRRVNQLLYRGNLSAAAAGRPALEKLADNLAAQIALARLSAMQNDAAGFSASMERTERLLDQSARLEIETRLDLVALYLSSDLPADATRQLGEMVAALDEAALRRLSPGAQLNLLSLTAQLGVAWPDAHLSQLAGQLAPPDGRP